MSREQLDMDNNIFSLEKIRKSVINKSLTPLSNILVDTNGKPSCEEVSKHLRYFGFFHFYHISDNNTFICFSNLTKMHQTEKIPHNVFWVSYLDFFDVYPEFFKESFQKIISNILSNGFKLKHFVSFEDEKSLSLFRYYEKLVDGVKQFTGFYLVISNYEEYFKNEKFKGFFESEILLNVS